MYISGRRTPAKRAQQHLVPGSHPGRLFSRCPRPLYAVFVINVPSTPASPATKHGGRRMLSTDRGSGVSMSTGCYAVSVPLPDANNKTAMSAVGQKRTLTRIRPMSALPPKADIAGRCLNVRFVPEAAVSNRSKSSPTAPANSGRRWWFSVHLEGPLIAFRVRRNSGIRRHYGREQLNYGCGICRVS
jgi:hypothetical protein